MSYGVEESTTPTVEPTNESADVLELLADDDTRSLFHRARAPKTVPELAEECDLPRSTAYRKAKRLIEADLLVPMTRTAGDTGTATEYRRTVERIEIEIESETTVEFRR